ncbi:hypothetical protein ACFSCW_15865 [Sphingomonas tabacisoli]|uniref:Uncharacterized protein n=1 Tax=Sphingomonas tabacisoli TaxID=2249466 RepID=A0ABW4I5M9_9SPHN
MSSARWRATPRRKLFPLAAPVLAGCLTAAAASPTSPGHPSAPSIGPVEITTLKLPAGVTVRSATYTPSGKVLLSYSAGRGGGPDPIRLATMDDDGRNFRPFFAKPVAEKAQSNGTRYMVFADNRRVLLGDYVIECREALEECRDPALLPVKYPAEIASGDHIAVRWSEIVIAPDNRHMAWTTLFANYSAMVFLGELRRDGSRYVIDDPRIISTLDRFRNDPAHADGVLPRPLLGGEVKQFVHGGRALSVVGAAERDLPGSVVIHLDSGDREVITNPPGYTETTIFSPDERLGIVMSPRFAERTDLKLLSLMPRPYPDSLNMGLSMLAYTHSVTGVRRGRPGTVGPVLIDIGAARSDHGHLGIDLARDEKWVFYSPMSWHPGSRKAMWIEGEQGTRNFRVRIASLPDYRPAAGVAVEITPVALGSPDLSVVRAYAAKSQDIDVKVYGRKSGYITYRRSRDGRIEKRYADFSDDGKRIYSGQETMQAGRQGKSVYTADLRLSGAESGTMALKMTFGPLGAPIPAPLIFDGDSAGAPQTSGYVEYAGKRLTVDNLVP